jgi:hypothetical protein
MSALGALSAVTDGEAVLALFHLNRVSLDFSYVSRQWFIGWTFKHFTIRAKGGVVTGADKSSGLTQLSHTIVPTTQRVGGSLHQDG